ncbi:hypothetical protein [Nannocystis radixulma]|uniref:Uncharacterized protein n=1 Tax=Nannocystis radixulma TaxID=2995305 RepID=A0ABT5B1H9_9BACT|nr:hypothetical protein [Nannocystis radixulma]MDC0667967.1 hypothetical protein [Nannocystis radixulma]
MQPRREVALLEEAEDPGVRPIPVLPQIVEQPQLVAGVLGAMAVGVFLQLRLFDGFVDHPTAADL